MNESQSDFALLQAFVGRGEQAAFTQVVQRHLDLVYATAFRKLQEVGAAQEVAQNAFAALARKAWQFGPEDSVPSWLYQTTLLAAKEWLRKDMRRRRREQTAAELGTTLNQPEDQAGLRALVPLLDEGLLSLRQQERTALLLRFYENQPLKAVGGALGVGENAAQKRVAGALEKLAQFFQRRGFKTATTAVAVAALQHTATSAPAAVAQSLALASAQMAPPSLLGLAGLVTRLAAWTKPQVAAVCLALAAVPISWQWHARTQADTQLARFRTEAAQIQTELATLQADLEKRTQSLEELDAALAAGRARARSQTDTQAAFNAWKARVRQQLLGADYRWPEDGPFVRIPKSALLQLSLARPIVPPGVLSQAARELLGLAPQEREALEQVLRAHFSDLNALVETHLCETNHMVQGGPPATAVASKIWYLPPLGQELSTRGEAMQNALRELVGPERWPLVQAQLSAGGLESTRQVLCLDDSQTGQAYALWVKAASGRFTLNLSVCADNSVSSMGGLDLDLFRGGEGRPTLDPAEFLGVNSYPEALKSRMLHWVREQLAQHPAKKEAL